MSNVDVLNLEWGVNSSRDRVMATLVCNYLRLQGLRVKEASIFDGYNMINKTKPKLLFMTNSTGAPENVKMMRYASKRKILSLTLTSEGNFARDVSNYLEMIWGWNKEKILFEDLQLQWSQRTASITLDLHKELKGRVKVSGGVGFDTYRIKKNFINKREFLQEKSKQQYKKIVGVGCFDFGTYYPSDPRYRINIKSFSRSEIERFRQDGNSFDEILTNVATMNPDILFLIKQHPGEMLGFKASGIQKLSKLPNVLILKDELPIIECIHLSDFWLVYESTTALEAWLLGKKTCLLNPSGGDFPREGYVSKGSPVYLNEEQLQRALTEFYSFSTLPGFDDLRQAREEAIRQTIQWADGLNHVRAGNAIIDLIKLTKMQSSYKSEDLSQRYLRWKQHIKWVISPLLFRIKDCPNNGMNRINFKKDDLDIFNEEILKEQLFFYRENNFSLSQLRHICCL